MKVKILEEVLKKNGEGCIEKGKGESEEGLVIVGAKGKLGIAEFNQRGGMI